MKRGDIFYVDLRGARGSETDTKIRPALVIQNDVGNKYSPVTIIAPITSFKGVGKTYPTEVFINRTESGLPDDSIVLLNQIRTVDKSRLGKKIGSLTAVKMLEVNKAIRVSLAL